MDASIARKLAISQRIVLTEKEEAKMNEKEDLKEDQMIEEEIQIITIMIIIIAEENEILKGGAEAEVTNMVVPDQREEEDKDPETILPINNIQEDIIEDNAIDVLNQDLLALDQDHQDHLLILMIEEDTKEEVKKNICLDDY